MNIHVPLEIQNKYRCLEFRGKPFDYKGRTMIKAKHKTLGSMFYYSFIEDFAWMVTNEQSIPEWYMVKL